MNVYYTAVPIIIFNGLVMTIWCIIWRFVIYGNNVKKTCLSFEEAKCDDENQWRRFVEALGHNSPVTTTDFNGMRISWIHRYFTNSDLYQAVTKFLIMIFSLSPWVLVVLWNYTPFFGTIHKWRLLFSVLPANFNHQ